MLDGEAVVQCLSLFFRCGGERLLVQDADGRLRAHHGDLGAGPGVDRGGTKRAGVHGDVRAAIDLASDQRDAGNGGLGERVQQLRSAANDAFPFHADAWQVARYVDDHDERYTEGVAEANETGCLLGTFGVQAAAESDGVVGDHADGAATDAAETDDDAASPAALELLERRFAFDVVEQFVNDRVHVVGTTVGFGHQCA
ncbi:unannotated protein [freshwater metagenome]|uniref:Unannotated protein n=1 Tax=freshwater metagenome TaxID=449393 RepID=A0A6J7HNP7_9ZZZZ